MDFTSLIDLASERLGGSVLAANDEFFAPKENLLKTRAAIFIEDKYIPTGKWMDGWETRRRRVPGHDWCIIRLGVPGVIRGVVVDTSHFKGNFPESCSIEGRDGSSAWIEILPKSRLQGDSRNLFAVSDPHRFTHLRLNIFPDGGVARLRVHGESIPEAKRLRGEIDLAAIENGAVALECSDMFFGNRHNLLMPGRSRRMDDGWETKRRRGPGHDWMTIRLAAAGTIERIEVDTSHFKGNAPGSCSLEASDDGRKWHEVLASSPLRPHKRHFFKLHADAAATHVRFNIFPDGGVARLHLYGKLTVEGRRHSGLRLFNTLVPERAEAELLRCCASANWAAAMAERRPFAGLDAMQDEADRIWKNLGREDWLEAFAGHPRIGEKKSRGWASQEQSRARSAGASTLRALVEANRA